MAIVDTGGFGYRPLLVKRLAERGLKPSDITDLLVTHAHHDHCINWTLFRDARIVIGRAELAWALEQPWGETAVPELYVRELKDWPTAHQANDGEEVMPGITAHAAPGHTPGHLVFVLHGKEQDVIFAGDAAKNRAELLTRKADASYDAAVTAATIEMLWTFWRSRPGNIMVPGHDMPMIQEDGRTDLSGQAGGDAHGLVRRQPGDHHVVRADGVDRKDRQHVEIAFEAAGRPPACCWRWRRRPRRRIIRPSRCG